MVQINFGQREVSCKVVFYGPGMSGKTTNLEIIHKKAPKDAVGEMVSIATETDRTLYFDFLPLDLGQVAGMRTRFQLYTVPGQIYYNATRKLVLQGVDGVIFVADSAPEKMPENLESFQNLRDNLTEMGLNVDDPTSQGFVPVVLQYNKRDLPTAQSVADMNTQMNPNGAPTFEAVARDGKGVFATLKEISRLVIEKLNKEHAPAAGRRRTAQNLEPVKSSPVPAPTPARSPQLPPPPPVHQTPAVQHTPSGQRTIPAATARSAPPPPPPPPAQRFGSGGHVPAHAPGEPSGAARRGYSPTAPTPAHGTPADEPSPREKHLSKAKPPGIDGRRPAPQADLGQTDPNLRRYQAASTSGGGAVRVLMIMLLVALLALAVLVILALLVPAVAAHMPPGIQRLLYPEPVTTTVTVPVPARAPQSKVATPVAVPVPATEPIAAEPAREASVPVLAPAATTAP